MRLALEGSICACIAADVIGVAVVDHEAIERLDHLQQVDIKLF